MTRDLDEGSYYVSRGGQIPVKWTAPEVYYNYIHDGITYFIMCIYRLYTIRSIQQRVMCGVLVVSCMRSGALDTNHLKATPTLKYVTITTETELKY